MGTRRLCDLVTVCPGVPCDLRLRRSFQMAKVSVGTLRLCDLGAFVRVALTARWSTKLRSLGGIDPPTTGALTVFIVPYCQHLIVRGL